MHGPWLWVLLAIPGVVAVAFAGLAFCGAGAGPFAQKWDDVYSGSFNDGAIDLNLTTGNGSITCRNWSGPGYRLIVHAWARGKTEAEARRLAAEFIQVEHGAGGIKVSDEGGWAPTAMVSIELYLPAGPEYHLQAKAGNGAVLLEGGGYASARVQTGNGDFKSTAAIGDLEARTGNGSIRMAAAGSGQWALTTGNGQISVDTANLGETGVMVDADTHLGKIVVEMDGQRMEQRGGPGHAALQMATRGYEQASRQLSIQARTNNGKITVLPSF